MKSGRKLNHCLQIAYCFSGENTTVEFLVLAGENPPPHFSTVLAFNSSRDGIIRPLRNILDTKNFHQTYTANEGPVRIRYKCLVPIYLFPEIKLCSVQPPNFQNRIIMFSPNSILIYLRRIYIFPGSVCLFCCSQISGPILGIYIAHRHMNVGIGTDAA
jgi:hypothetical protein